MERCDFSALAGILQAYYKEGHWTNQNDFMQKLFYSAYNDNPQRLEPSEDSAVSRWISGQQKLRSDFLSYYSKPENKPKLAKDMEQQIFPELYDSGMAAEKLYGLVCHDAELSQFKKKQLCAGYSTETVSRQAKFVADVVYFVMERAFVARKARSEKEPGLQAVSPALDLYNCNARVPEPCKYFQGRDEELEELYALLQEEEKVFLRGIPGIGKSELAKAYAERYRKKYSNCLYIPYTGSLKWSITNLNFSHVLMSGSDDERFQNNERLLQSLGPDSLLIVDNYNIRADEDEYFSKLMQYRCQILFTTRYRYPEDTEYCLQEISNQEDLVELVRWFYKKTDQHGRAVKEIIETLHRHTYAVELAARLLKRNVIKPRTLLRKLKAEKAAMDAQEKFFTRKDGERLHGTYYQHIHTLFSLYRLSDAEQFTLMNMCLLPLAGVHKAVCQNLLALKTMDSIERLIEKGYIEELYDVQVMLHPMVQEIALAEFRPTVSDCWVMLWSMHLICLNDAQHIPYYKSFFQCIISVVSQIEVDNTTKYLRFLEDAAACMIYYEDHFSARFVVDELEILLDHPGNGEERDRALVLDLEANLSDNSGEALYYAQTAINALPTLDKDTAQLTSNLHSNLSRLYMKLGRFEEADAEQKTAARILSKYHLTATGDAYAQAINKASYTALHENPQAGLYQLQQIEDRLLETKTTGSRAYADVLAWKGIVYLCMGNYEDGAVYCQKAVERFSEMFGPESDEVKMGKLVCLMLYKAKNVPQEWRVISLPPEEIPRLKKKALTELMRE